jgi:hypothetical protein
MKEPRVALRPNISMEVRVGHVPDKRRERVGLCGDHVNSGPFRS